MYSRVGRPRLLFSAYYILAFAAAAFGCSSAQPNPLAFHLGPAAIRPSGFFESIAMYRSASTGDTVNTRFGQIPLGKTPSETLVSAGHSRLQACTEIGGLSAYVETDFLNAPGKEPYRFRQYWGEYRIGKWRILAGQAWSLLRSNRDGIRSDSGLMNTLVVEPAYHVGLAGVRNRQLRIVHEDGNWTEAVSYESGRSFLAKLAHDSTRLHVEATGLFSRSRRATGFAAVIHAPRKINIVTQQVLSHGAGPDLLNTLPPGVNTLSTIEGLEVRARPTWELFAYGGMVLGGRSAGNRSLREWTAGCMHHLFQQRPWGEASIAAQVSQVGRSTWPGGEGRMTYVQVSFRYSVPGALSMFGDRERDNSSKRRP